MTLSNNKNNKIKKKSKSKIKKMIVWFLLFLVTLLLTWSFEPIREPILNFISETIFHNKPDLKIVVNSFYYLERNSINEINLSTELGYQVIKHQDGNIELKGLKTDYNTFTTWAYSNDSIITYHNFFTMIHKGLVNNTSYCFITTTIPKGEVEKDKLIKIKSWFDFENPNCENCLKHTVSIYNDGNKELEEVRVKICSTSEIFDITGRKRQRSGSGKRHRRHSDC